MRIRQASMRIILLCCVAYAIASSSSSSSSSGGNSYPTTGNTRPYWLPDFLNGLYKSPIEDYVSNYYIFMFITQFVLMVIFGFIFPSICWAVYSVVRFYVMKEQMKQLHGLGRAAT